VTQPADPPITVLLVDDDPLVRAGLTIMLGGAPDLRVVGDAGDGAQALALVDEHHPDVVLMDIRMPGMDGLTATERLRARRNAPEVIVLTTFDADQHVLRALRAGAAGFLVKDTPPEEIVAAVRQVARGNPVLSPTSCAGSSRGSPTLRQTCGGAVPGSGSPTSTTGSARWR